MDSYLLLVQALKSYVIAPNDSKAREHLHKIEVLSSALDPLQVMNATQQCKSELKEWKKNPLQQALQLKKLR